MVPKLESRSRKGERGTQGDDRNVKRGTREGEREMEIERDQWGKRKAERVKSVEREKGASLKTRIGLGFRKFILFAPYSISLHLLLNFFPVFLVQDWQLPEWMNEFGMNRNIKDGKMERRRRRGVECKETYWVEPVGATHFANTTSLCLSFSSFVKSSNKIF